MLFNPGSDLVGLLQTLAPLFSLRLWPYAPALLLGSILAPGKHTVSAILRVLGLGDRFHFQDYHRVLNRAQGSPRDGARRLFAVLVQTFAPRGPLVLG